MLTSKLHNVLNILAPCWKILTGLLKQGFFWWDYQKSLASGRPFLSSSASCIQSSHTYIHTYIHTFGFIEKTSVKQDLNCIVCSNFQMSFFHLVRRTQNRWGFRSGWHFVRSSGQADLWSDIPPPSGFGSGWHLVTFWVRLTFGQMYTPWSGFGSGWHLVTLWISLTFGQVYLPRSAFGSGWYLVTLWVRLTFGQVYLPGSAFGSAWHLVTLWVRLTSGQIYPLAETSCGQVFYYFSLMVKTKRNQEKVVVTKICIYGKTKWKMNVGATKIQPDGSGKKKISKRDNH